MRIRIMTVGSRGDVQPYVVLGQGLQAAGHDVVVATHASFAEFVTSRGLGFRPVEGNPQEILQSKEGQAWLANTVNPVVFMRRLRAVGEPLIHRLYQDALEACGDADVILFSFLAAGCSDVAEALHVPAVGALLQPVTPTRHFPVMLSPVDLGPFNRLSYGITLGLMAWMFRDAVNHARTTLLHLPARPRAGSYADIYERLRIPVLYGFSPTVVPPPPDWGQDVHVTGYWFPPVASGYVPPPELQAFLEAGPPPVFVGFGSMVEQAAERMTDVVLQALAASGQRALVQAGWGGLSTHQLPAHVLSVGPLPHEWLFPRVAAVVHHGGAGTTGTALRAGVPSVVVPFFSDQPFWGGRVHVLGAGPKPIPREKLTVARLAAALTQATTDAGMRQRAQETGQRIQAEDGVAQAVKQVEQYLGRVRQAA